MKIKTVVGSPMSRVFFEAYREGDDVTIDGMKFKVVSHSTTLNIGGKSTVEFELSEVWEWPSFLHFNFSPGPMIWKHTATPTGGVKSEAVDLGRKDDKEKPRLSLVLGDFARALIKVGEVGTFGARKYSAGNWLKVENALERYWDAMYRHAFASKIEENDKESGLPHLAHMAWCALALLELSERKVKEDEEKARQRNR